MDNNNTNIANNNFNTDTIIYTIDDTIIYATDDNIAYTYTNGNIQEIISVIILYVLGILWFVSMIFY
jgi:hypothetical protein